MGIREQQKEKRREEILDAALDLFIRKGYAGTKISDIAEQVGMSTGLLFHYFPSKEKLYEELVAIGISGPTNMIAAVSVPPLQFFEDAAEQILGFLKTAPFVAKMFVLMRQTFYSEAVPQGVGALLEGFDIYAPTTLLIQKGQAEGSIRPGDPYALALAYWCAIQGIAELLARDPETPCPESEWIVDLIRRKEA